MTESEARYEPVTVTLLAFQWNAIVRMLRESGADSFAHWLTADLEAQLCSSTRERRSDD